MKLCFYALSDWSWVGYICQLTDLGKMRCQGDLCCNWVWREPRGDALVTVSHHASSWAPSEAAGLTQEGGWQSRLFCIGCHFWVWAVGWTKVKERSWCGYLLLLLNVLLAMWHMTCPVVLYLIKDSLGRGKLSERTGRLERLQICHTSDYGDEKGGKGNRPTFSLESEVEGSRSWWEGHVRKQAEPS